GAIMNNDNGLQHVSGSASPEDYTKVELGKKVTLLRGISIIVGIIIGAGIFISPKGILQNSGSIGMSLIVWISCGVLSLFGALSYAELGTCIQKSGGHYTYVLEAFGPKMAFIRLWVELIAIRPAAMAVISLAFGQYILEPLFMPCDVPLLAVEYFCREADGEIFHCGTSVCGFVLLWLNEWRSFCLVKVHLN
ncbi:unnamed protein product, partial [Tetraodon nigroviridis]